jgi:hypothetical protein
MKNIPTLAAVFAAIFLVGCGTPRAWYQSGKSFEETRRDLAVCRAEAARLSNPLAMASLAFAIANDANMKSYVKNCMIAKGYDWVDTNSLLPAVARVPK